ncbi:O-fucosyltransferase 20-like [Olea europaea subsp. europaea]|uniref:O-fucosyltransferase family protein n=1 Tax=Olea europaea subsp. europaea TaxID=158383 RepID=A0A8S0TDS5_OLEEU|nr:O-fucosyltransferase 20-like [Olea europaea subsp. europaea]
MSRATSANGKDVWVRTGCLPGLTPEYDEMINYKRKKRPEILTSRSNMTCHDRKLAGLCPLNALEVKRGIPTLKTCKVMFLFPWLGFSKVWELQKVQESIGLGGQEALLPLKRAFLHLYKEDLALPEELKPFEKKASIMAAIDYIVSKNSDVFLASHGGNMGHAIPGHGAYAGRKKTITPNRREMLPYFLNSSLPEAEFNRIMLNLHRYSFGKPELRNIQSQSACEIVPQSIFFPPTPQGIDFH